MRFEKKKVKKTLGIFHCYSKTGALLPITFMIHVRHAIAIQHDRCYGHPTYTEKVPQKNSTFYLQTVGMQLQHKMSDLY